MYLSSHSTLSRFPKLVIFLVAMSLLISAGQHPAKRKLTPQEKANILKDPNIIYPSQAPILVVPGTRTRSSRDIGLTSFLVDSSKNGYGPYLGSPNPIAYNPETGGVVMVYRQWAGFDETAGYIGVAQSEDGEDWFVEQRVNTAYPEGVEEPNLPTATGTPQGRYPSAILSIEQNRATAVWNEYTNASNGGGTYGGRPLYVYDFFDLGENSNFSSTHDLNTGCATFPCDPPDLWTGNVQLVDGMDGPVTLALYDGWSDNNHYMIRSGIVIDGYILPTDPYIIASGDQYLDNGDPLWYDGGGYTSGPDYHINSDGVGYMVQTGFTSYSEQGIDPSYHTIFFKRTEDYGETWTSDGGFENTGYHYLSDEAMVSASTALYEAWEEAGDESKLWLGDEIEYNDGTVGTVVPGWYFWYNQDVRTDQDGGLHSVVVASPLVTVGSYPMFELSVHGDSSETDLTVGFHPDATDGYDEGMDTYAPPAPPSGFDAA